MPSNHSSNVSSVLKVNLMVKCASKKYSIKPTILIHPCSSLDEKLLGNIKQGAWPPNIFL
jgi:hypothetical protein